jgi:glutamate-1-semialdehyde aminotransferase
MTIATDYVKRAEAVLAGGPATYSKSWTRYGPGTPPLLVGGQGAEVWDLTGASWIDTVAALGAILLGAGHPAVQEAVHRQVDRGASFSLLHPLEVEVAELICELVPCAEQVRFVKNGGDATAMAVRLARAVTHRPYVLASGYHGQHSWYIASTDRPAGTLAAEQVYTRQLPWGETSRWQQALRQLQGQVAAVIVEVPPASWRHDQNASFLHSLRRWTSEAGTVFILDEVVTGFRYRLGGAQAYYHVVPDLTCLGKGLANGYPLAAIAGPRALMRRFGQEVFCSSTAGGEAVSLAAAKATLLTLRDTEALAVLSAQGQALGQGLADLFTEDQLPVEILGNHARLLIQWQDVPGVATAAALKTLWLQETARRGVLFGGPTFPMTCYTAETVDTILAAAHEAAVVIRVALEHQAVTSALEGPVIEDVFGDRYRGGEDALDLARPDRG